MRPFGQTRSVSAIADRDDRGAGAQGEHRQPVRASWSAPSGLRVPPGRRTGRGRRRGCRCAEPERLDVGGAAVDRMDAAVVQHVQPTIGQSNSSRLPSQWMRRPSRGDQPRAEQDGVEVRDVVGGEDHRALARDLVDVALDPDPRERLGADAGARAPSPPTVSLVDRPVGSGSVIGRWRGSRVRVGAPRASASRIAPATMATVSSKSLPSVVMIRASAAARSGATARLVSSSSRRRSASRIALGLRAVRIEAALLGPAPRALLDRGVEVQLEVRVGQHDRADVAAGHDDPAVRRERPLALEQRRAELGRSR